MFLFNNCVFLRPAIENLSLETTHYLCQLIISPHHHSGGAFVHWLDNVSDLDLNEEEPSSLDW